MGSTILGRGKALAQDTSPGSTALTNKDIKILRFLAAAELIESDLWQQYAELGGLTSGDPMEVDKNQQLNSYEAALSNLDPDGPQYITSNTIDEISHATFLNGYLQSKGVDPVDFTAAFHFGYIEQGRSSLYQALSQKVSSLEVLKITLGIGGDEVAHFLEWIDFAGNGVQPTVAPVSDDGLTFPNFFSPLNPLKQPSPIFPVPCEFISANLPHCAVIRPSSDKFAGAVAATASFTEDGLFVGQQKKCLTLLQHMAEAADAAQREC